MAAEPLEDFIENVCGTSRLRVEADLGDGFVRLRSEEAERRQAAHDIRSSEDIVIELLRNARDAHAHAIFLALGRDDATRRIVMVDDGDGIPPALQSLVFEPRVTSKLDSVHLDKWGVHGRGMALYSIATNAEAAYVAASAPGLGTSLCVETDLRKVGERADQSCFPTFTQTDEGTVSIRGPRNILRTACEFALEHRKDLSVYLGSAAEVAATLYAFGTATTSASLRAFSHDDDGIPVCKRLAYAVDEADFAERSAALGLPLSERTAHRILKGTLRPLDTLLERISASGFGGTGETGRSRAPKRSGARHADARGLKVAQDDLAAFAARVGDAYAELAGRYYLEPAEPQVRVGKDAVRITIPVDRLR